MFTNGAGDAYGRGWAGKIYPYIKSVGVFACPSDPFYGVPGTVSYSYNLNIVLAPGVNGGIGLNSTQLTAPSSTVLCFETQNASGQVVNIQGESTLCCTNTMNLPKDSGAGNGTPSSLYTFAAYATGVFSNFTLVYTPVNCSSDSALNGGYCGTANYGTVGFYQMNGRHTGGANYVLADGHVKWLQGSQVSSGAVPWPMLPGTCSQNFYGILLSAGTGCSSDTRCAGGHCAATFSPT